MDSSYRPGICARFVTLQSGTFVSPSLQTMSKPRKRSPKGSVRVEKRGSQLRLRWTSDGKEFTLPAGRNTPMNERLAKLKAAEIEKDIMLGEFDRTLAKYRPKQSADSDWESTSDLFQLFINHKRSEVTGQSISTRYNALAGNLKRFGLDIHTEQEARQFVDYLRSRQSPRIANQNLGLLKAFMTWAIEQSHVENNLFEPIKPSKVSNVPSPKRQPLTPDEVRRILDAALIDPRLSHYHDFIYALFSLGVRPSELIGMRWQNIDWARRIVRISESLSRGEDGRSSGGARKRKATKTGTAREVPIGSGLFEILQKRKSESAKPGDLVFTSPKGGAIDDRNFNHRIFKRVLAKAGVDERVTYVCRHTCLSQLHQDGATLGQLAKIAGHKTIRMVSEVYVQARDLPQMPEY